MKSAVASTPKCTTINKKRQNNPSGEIISAYQNRSNRDLGGAAGKK